MLKFILDGSLQKLDNNALEVDDAFALVGHNSFSGNPNSILCYQVKKCLKNEVVCARDPSFESTQPVEIRLKRTKSTPHCYSLDCPKLTEIRLQIRLQTRRAKANKILKDFPILEFGDDELLAAIEAYGERQQKKAE